MKTFPNQARFPLNASPLACQLAHYRSNRPATQSNYSYRISPSIISYLATFDLSRTHFHSGHGTWKRSEQVYKHTSVKGVKPVLGSHNRQCEACFWNHITGKVKGVKGVKGACNEWKTSSDNVKGVKGVKPVLGSHNIRCEGCEACEGCEGCIHDDNFKHFSPLQKREQGQVSPKCDLRITPLSPCTCCRNS